MKIASFNINGIRARIATLLRWLSETKPDVVILQEIKSTDETFPKNEIEQLGYNIQTHGQKSFNGVAILSLFSIEDLKTGLDGDPEDLQARWIEAEINTLRICGLYLPNGNPCPGPKFDYKIEWMKKFNSYIQELKNNNIPIIISGDFNVIPSDDDVYSPENFKNDACAHPLTREQYRILINMGFTDLVKHFVEGKTNWTFWGYRGGGWQKGNGLRIDHFLTTANVTDLVKNVTVNREPRGWEKASDHTPVTITLEN